jgi:hypothetical protein
VQSGWRTEASVGATLRASSDPAVWMDRDSITRTGARTPGVERLDRSHGGAHKRILPDTEQGNRMIAESTKDDGKPVGWEGLV